MPPAEFPGATAVPSSPPRELIRGDLVSSGQRLDDALVVVEQGRVAWTGPAASWSGEDGDLPAPAPGRLILPGLVDVHCHGAVGHGLADEDPDGIRAAADHHLAHGTTTLLGSLAAAPADVTVDRMRTMRPIVEAGELAGIHLEGPFLSQAQRGAQDPDAIVPGDPDALRRFLDAAAGTIRSMTLAPETPRLQELLDLLAGSDVTPSFGHTGASADVTRTAISAVGGGRLSATHLFNGMPSMHHRSPGPVAACLAAAAQGAMVVELIGDGVHLAEDTVATVFALVGPDQIALITDAMAGAGMPDGRYQLGGRDVDVVNGVARLRTGDGSQGPIAGGVSRLIDVLRRTVLVAGVPLPTAVTAATATPARLIGLEDEVGDVVPGRRADLLITGDDLMPRAVMRAGRWVHGELPEGN